MNSNNPLHPAQGAPKKLENPGIDGNKWGATIVTQNPWSPKKITVTFARQIGSGGFGVAYEAYKKFSYENGQFIEKPIKTPTVYKVLKSQYVTKFNAELKSMQAVDATGHYNVKEVTHSLSLLAGTPLLPGAPLIMTEDAHLLKQRRMPGKSLQELSKEGALDNLSETKKLALGILSGLSIVRHHRSGRAHLDIKLGNLIADLNEPIVNVIDEGLAQNLGTAMGQKGTPSYKAPEIFCDKSTVSTKMDAYSFAVMLVFMFFGKDIFKDIAREQCAKHRYDEKYANSVGLYLADQYYLLADQYYLQKEDADLLLDEIFSDYERHPLTPLFKKMLHPDPAKRCDVLDGLNELEERALEIELEDLGSDYPEDNKTQKRETLKVAQQLRVKIEQAPYPSASPTLITDFFANNPGILANQEQLTIFTNTLNMDGVRDCKSKEELIERVKISCYLETILYQIHSIEPDLSTPYGKSQKTYIRLLKNELLALQKSPDGSSNFEKFSRHIEKRLLAYYCHSMRCNNWENSKFKKGLEDLINHPNLLFKKHHESLTLPANDFKSMAEIEHLAYRSPEEKAKFDKFIPEGNPITQPFASTTAAQLEQRIKSHRYIETILNKIKTMNSNLRVGNDESQKTYIRLLKKELLALQKDPDGLSHFEDFEEFSKHVEARIVTYYCHVLRFCYDAPRGQSCQNDFETLMTDNDKNDEPQFKFTQHYPKLANITPGQKRSIDFIESLEKIAGQSQKDVFIPKNHPIVKFVATESQVRERDEGIKYIDQIASKLNLVTSDLNIDNDNSKGKYITLLKNELHKLKKQVAFKLIPYNELTAHVEARIFTYYCHSMQHEGWKISRFRKGLEEIMNDEALLFNIHFKHPGTTRDFNLKAKLERLSSLENTNFIPSTNPVRSSRVMDIELDAIDKDIFNNALRASFQPSNSASHMDHRINEIAKEIRDSRPVFSKDDIEKGLDRATLKNTDKVCYRHCMKFLIQLNTIKTTRDDKKAELKVAIIDFLRRGKRPGRIGETEGDPALKICLFDAYTEIKKSELNKPLAFFHKSSNLGDFLRKFMIGELGIIENLIPLKYSLEEFREARNNIMDAQPSNHQYKREI